MEKESNGELVFLDTLLNRNNEKISAFLYRKPTHTDQYLHYSSHPKQVAKKGLFPPCLIEHIPLSTYPK